MKIVIAKNALRGPLEVLAKVINNKNIYPILDNFLFEVKDGKVNVTASDNDVFMTTTLQVVECEGEGKICVPAKSFIDGIKEIPEQPITLEFEGLEITAGYQNGHFKMVGQNADEYPERKAIEGKEITISGKDLSSAINSVLYAAANDELRPIMCGVYFDMRGEYIYFVTSDGTRLISNKRQAATGDMASFVLPKKPAGLVRGFAESENDIKILSDGRYATFVGGGYSLTCRLTDGNFPKWENVIPRNNNYQAEIDRLALLNAIKRVSVFASISGLVRLDFSQSELRIQGENPDFSVSAKETMPCTFNGELTIGFKGSHLTEVLSNLQGENVILHMSEPSKAGLITSDDMIVILMPMVIQ